MIPNGTLTTTPVRTRQSVAHPRLPEVVQKHLQHPWRGGRHAPTSAAFEVVARWVEGSPDAPLIFDSGCGTGESTEAIAAEAPDALVIGIDRSAARLARSSAPRIPWRAGNCIWVRAELAAFWRLAARAGWKLRQHYLLYPNPWPKAAHLRCRWHGHPVLPDLLALGGCLELRTNWQVYAVEFATALAIAEGRAPDVAMLGEESIGTPFQRKYQLRGQPLFRVRAELG